MPTFSVIVSKQVEITIEVSAKDEESACAKAEKVADRLFDDSTPALGLGSEYLTEWCGDAQAEDVAEV